jgi:DNA (cytosine-5)-methyltransferase 1
MILPDKKPKPPYVVPTMAQINSLPWNGRTVISTFSGGGGSSCGYKMAGYRVLLASEFIPAAQETYRANFPGTVLDTGDIRKLTAESILERTGLAVGELDIFDGSPPCASFSMAGIREDGWGKVKKYSDSEQRTDDLFFEYVRLLNGLMPKVFIAENVKGLTLGKATDVLGEPQLDMFDEQDDTIYHQLCDAGYEVAFRVLNAADLGVPQSRQRVIFIGVRKDLVKIFDVHPTYPSPLPFKYTLAEALAGTPAGSAVEPETSMEGYATGAEWERLAVGDQSEKYFSLVRCGPDKPCPTICASHGSKGIACTAHPHEKRKFSIAELRRICAFPDDFVLTGDFARKWERLGRSVPPVMMAAISSAVLDGILNKVPK